MPAVFRLLTVFGQFLIGIFISFYIIRIISHIGNRSLNVLNIGSVGQVGHRYILTLGDRQSPL